MTIVIYIVECADKTLYTGWTTDVARRVKEHNGTRGAKYTGIHGPVRLVYTEEQPNRSAAMKRERQIKRLSRDRKLKLIEDYSPTKK